jgi:hypothetical protein
MMTMMPCALEEERVICAADGFGLRVKQGATSLERYD